MKITITDKNHYFEYPTQVIFQDPYDDRELAGIGYKDEVICGCCGTAYAVKAILTPKNSVIITLSWTNLVDEIKGN